MRRGDSGAVVKRFVAVAPDVDSWLSSSDYHSYFDRERVCTGPCDMQEYERLLALRARPFSTGILPTNGQIQFAGPGFVRTYYGETSDTMFNVTIPGAHFLDPGAVMRWVSTDVTGSVYVNTWGVGAGMAPRVNEFLAPLVWRITNIDLRLGR